MDAVRGGIGLPSAHSLTFPLPPPFSLACFLPSFCVPSCRFFSLPLECMPPPLGNAPFGIFLLSCVTLTYYLLLMSLSEFLPTRGCTSQGGAPSHRHTSFYYLRHHCDCVRFLPFHGRRLICESIFLPMGGFEAWTRGRSGFRREWTTAMTTVSLLQLEYPGSTSILSE